jgi:hypothetical protein
VVSFTYTPVARAQLAIWIEDAAGHYLATVALSEAVAYRGIGNRPGASEMNSGYRWPYGRREGVLPIWALRRASAAGAQAFPRVIYQDRPEGYASKLTPDQSPDAYYCLQFDPSHATRDELDAVSCASQFNSDKGRYLSAADLAANYAEPWEPVDGSAAGMRALPLTSLYPPRLDVTRCTSAGCYDHADVARYAADARAAMPEIDAVTRATAPGDTPQTLLFTIPSDWPSGAYVAFIEVNLEGDYNAQWNATNYPTPQSPKQAWDSYALEFGYAYRGQPSLAFRVPFDLDDQREVTAATDTPAGRSSWDYAAADYGALEPISLVDTDPNAISDQAGSGADRLRKDADGHRFVVQVKLGTSPLPNGADAGSAPADATVPAADGGGAGPGPVMDLSLRVHPDKLRSYEWVLLDFKAANSALPIQAYEVRVATDPIVDESSFIMAGRPAKNATDDPQGATALALPTDIAAGDAIESALGDLIAQTHYYVGVRATDDMNQHGPIRVAEITTTARNFATVSPCFIATAAYGSALAPQIGALRALRDRYLSAVAPGRAFVAVYYTLSPPVARIVARSQRLRAAVRAMLSPLLMLAKQLT